MGVTRARALGGAVLVAAVLSGPPGQPLDHTRSRSALMGPRGQSVGSGQGAGGRGRVGGRRS
jgi:hypothetical protein